MSGWGILKDVQILITSHCECDHIYGQEDYENVFKLRIWRWDAILSHWGGPKCNHKCAHEKAREGNLT